VVRRPLASSLAAVAAIIGPAAAGNDLHPLFLRLLGDPDAHVHVAAADGAADLYSLVPADTQRVLLGQLGSVCADRTRPWPVQASLAAYVETVSHAGRDTHTNTHTHRGKMN
jgi:hypothetical protein